MTGTIPPDENFPNTCLADAPAPAEADVAAAYTDNCGGTVTANLVSSPTSGDDCMWSIEYTYEVSDECSNTTTTTITYTGGDSEAPTLIDPTMDCSSLDMTGVNECLVDAEGYDPTVLESNVAALYEDNCDDNLTASFTNETAGASNTDCSWSFTYEFSIQDACGNSVLCEVSRSGSDQDAPTLIGNLPPDGDQGNVCLDDAPDAPSESSIASAYTDNCGSVSATLEDTETTGTDCSWTVTYTYEVSDECANTTTVVFEYTGGDTEAPMLDGTLPGGNVGNVCLADAPAAPAGSVIADEFTDNCGLVSASLEQMLRYHR